MNLSSIPILIGLLLNTFASLIMLYPHLRGYGNIDDDYITDMDHEGNYIQKKHVKDKKLGIVGFVLFAVGFAFQTIGVVVSI
ncbi:hypothetical protein A3B85_02365 [Candidatus Nomurabacteria bacterium RIFCSPHIGHO2_02_FULL_37_13]|uniref:DUF4190 domain-containing protein n=1 Tax=Candidatus Nomurabacteria bacterium RIFCSPHIGHO2_02_FULL_37_13 TaxID=1801750 RepID=A0A1F6W6Q3_9BACT|nr:MAG: hypothetical protein UY15_C0001G0042 [Parcubacteria group bacterium GW2011_GWA2_47_9]OGI77608.1 MAG: hypothetical protein A3B85_02365 [Candidatus Nomurabacteria bacterium RIFCSPHIGHO2_02_FULL_37_13]OGI88097.1 MAG: hypothetical protein A2906_01205 [Candidatus Nomurabacteria bacterium RIFCSPLOWO2_01_FULL_37_25]